MLILFAPRNVFPVSDLHKVCKWTETRIFTKDFNLLAYDYL